jgi:hypothetical protein
VNFFSWEFLLQERKNLFVNDPSDATRKRVVKTRGVSERRKSAKNKLKVLDFFFEFRETLASFEKNFTETREVSGVKNLEKNVALFHIYMCV